MLGERDLEFYNNERLREYFSEDQMVSLLSFFRSSNYNYYVYNLISNTSIFKYKTFDEIKRMISKLIDHYYNERIYHIMTSKVILETKSTDEMFEIIEHMRKHKYNEFVSKLYLQEHIIRNRSQKEILELADFLRYYDYSSKVYNLINKHIVVSKINQASQLKIIEYIIESDYDENALILYGNQYVLDNIDSKTFLNMMKLLKESGYDKWMLNLAISKIEGRSNSDKLLLMKALLDSECHPMCYRVAVNQTIIKYRSLNEQIYLIKYCHEAPNYVVYLFCEDKDILEKLTTEEQYRLIRLLIKYNCNDYVYAFILNQVKNKSLSIEEQIKNVEDNETFKFYLKDQEEK